MIDLTEGPILKKTFLFAIPFLLSSLVQQLYSTVDLIFAGRFLGTAAAAAIGSGSILLTLVLGFFTGTGVGAGVLAGQAFGRGDKASVHRLIRTSARITILAGTVLTAVGIGAMSRLVVLIRVPVEIRPESALYLRICFLSMIPIAGYNLGAGILRASGDSRTPVWYQLAGGFINVACNYLLICVLRLGIAGAAAATVLSQSSAMLLVWRAILTRFSLPDPGRESDVPAGRIRSAKRRMPVFPAGFGLPDAETARSILKIGIPAGLQASVITFSNLLVQSQINRLGAVSIAAFTAYFKAENFIYYPIMAVGQAAAVYFAQNEGAGKRERIRRGCGLILSAGAASAAVIAAAMILFSTEISGVFLAGSPAAMVCASMIRAAWPFYFLYVFLEVLGALLRSKGDAVAPMAISLLNLCAFRLILLSVIMQRAPAAEKVVMIYPVTWFTATMCYIVVCAAKFGPRGCDNGAARGRI